MEPRGGANMHQSGTISIKRHENVLSNVELPPSKSHLIRWLLLAAQTEGKVRLSGVKGASDDAITMLKAIQQLGVNIDIESDSWTVHGVGPHGFQVPLNPIQANNSGTSFRLLGVALTRIGEPVIVDGDQSLRERFWHPFWDSLRVISKLENNSLPVTIKGPIVVRNITLDVSRTSQYLSALLLSMPALEKPIELSIEGSPVSQRHASLSFDLAALCGSENKLENTTLKPWNCQAPSNVEIPPDASHIAFWKLYENLHNCTLNIPTVNDEDALGAEILFNLDFKIKQKISLRDANDLITPLAASMAIGGGGEITNVAHARHKETNRIEKTVELLSYFSIKATATKDGLIVEGGQSPVKPSLKVPTFGDHRMQMTAVVLASMVGADIEGGELHRVSFPKFLDFFTHDVRSVHPND